jgi:hypothetical protein
MPPWWNESRFMLGGQLPPRGNSTTQNFSAHFYPQNNPPTLARKFAWSYMQGSEE